MTVYTAPWGGPLAEGNLGTLQLIGDVQTNWETYRPTDAEGQNTTYDAIGRDITDQLLLIPPIARFQMGDISDSNANLDPNLVKQRFALFDAWCGDYNLEMYKIMGNHDVPTSTLTPAEWATYWGYPSPCYTVDNLGDLRVVVLGGDSNAPEPTWEPSPHTTPAVPLSSAQVTWLDQQLAADTRPTLIMNHAPFSTEPTSFGTTEWYSCQATRAYKLACTDLLDALDSHSHVIAWCHGHTHNDFFDKEKPNTGLMSVGSRQIARIDAGACYTQAVGVGVGRPVTFYVSVLDDGRTTEVRWRDHGSKVWTAPLYTGRFDSLTAT